MTPEQIAMIEVAKSLGSAAPLVSILIYLLIQAERREARASTERRETSDRFLLTLSGVVADNRLAVERLTVAITEQSSATREEHRSIMDGQRALIDAIGKMHNGQKGAS